MQELLHVLLIQDPESQASGLHEALQETGRQIEPQVVHTPQTLRAALDMRLPDLVVGDCDMRRFRCDEALAIVRSKAPDLPMILISTWFAQDRTRALISAGVDALIEKDELNRIAGAVEQALAQSTERITQDTALHARDPARDRQRLLNGLFASAVDAIVSADQDQRIVLFNPAAEQMFGYRAVEVQGAPLSTLMPERFREAHSTYVSDFGLAGTTKRRLGTFGLVTGKKKNGEEFALDATISHWGNGSTKLYTAVLRPVEADTPIEDSRAVLAAIVESAEDAIVGKTLDGIIRTWSPGAKRLFGYGPAEIVGQPVTVLLPPDRQDEEQLIIERIKRGERVESYESKRLCKDGSLVDVSLTISPIRSDDGTIIGASKIARNISARIAAEKRERRLTAFYAALSQTNEALLYVREPAALYEEICRVCVEHGQVTLAFIALIRDKHIEPVAAAGSARQFLQGLSLSVSPDLPEGRGPVATAIRAGRRYIANDFHVDPIAEPWRERALRLGTRAAAVVPFRRAGAVEGAIVLHVTEKDFFDTDLINLLEEIGADLSFALDNFDRDVARADAERALRRSETRLLNAQMRAKLGSWEYDLATGLTHWSEQMFRLFQCDPSEGVPPPAALLQMIHPEDRAVYTATHAHAAKFHTAGSCEFRSSPDGGPTRWFSANVEGYADAQGKVGILAGTVQDITERKNHESRIEHLGTHDGLTDLPNGILMRDRIAQAIALAKRSGRQVAVVYVDLDRFKSINDGYGHQFGDAVLRAAATRLESALRECDTVARLGGDEFLILLAELGKQTDAHVVTQKVLDYVRRPFDVGDRTIHLSASIGVSIYPQHGTEVDVLIGNADIAMYRSKQGGGDSFQFFTAEMSESTRLRVRLETELRLALGRGQLSLVYQPKVDLANGRITGCEALLRWSHPELGAVSPAQFIPIAEDTGLILTIGDWVLRSACRQNKAWRDAGLPPIVVSVNLSARQFRQSDMTRWVREVLTETGLAAEAVELELTESLLAEDTENIIDTVNALKQLGIKLSIDDFGTGFSSLAYLKRFRVDTLKIDQSFIRNMLTEPDDATIAIAIIALAHSLRMSVIAEGVETAEHCRILRGHGCDAIQGYFISKPVEPEKIADLLRQGTQFPQVRE
jgi:diguanylate cyclase (GGDEF)-like protein/PAS domain S-box-containing protein